MRVVKKNLILNNKLLLNTKILHSCQRHKETINNSCNNKTENLKKRICNLKYDF